MNAVFMCVVVTLSAFPSHSPVENPAKVCSAYFDGCGRPSIQITRSARPNVPTTVNATRRPDTGSTILVHRTLGPGPRMKYCAGCGLACCSGCDRTEASQLSAFCLAAAFNGSPV